MTQDSDVLTTNTNTPEQEQKAQAELKQGKKLFIEKKYTEAAPLLESGLKTITQDTEARSAIIQLYSGTGQQDEALRHILFMLREHPKNVNLLIRAANIYKSKSKLDTALKYFANAITAKPDIISLYWAAYQTMVEMERYEQSLTFAKQTLKVFSDDPLALLMVARSERLNNNLQAAKQYIDLVSIEAIPATYQYIALEERAHIYESNEEYDKAFHYYEKANTSLLTNSDIEHLDIDTPINRIDLCKTWFLHNNVSDWALPIDDGIKSPIFVVGFPTTGNNLLRPLFANQDEYALLPEGATLDYIIRLYSERTGQPVSEPHFLADLSSTDITYLRKEFQKFISEKTLKRDVMHLPFVDTSPFNTFRLGMINRIYPEAKIIMMLRDPRDVVLDVFRRLNRVNNISVRFNVPENAAFVYEKFMSLYQCYDQNLPIGIMEMRYEDIIEEPEEATRQLLAFLGKEYSEDLLLKPKVKHNNAYWQHYEKQLQKVMPKLTPFVEDFGYNDNI